MKEVKSTVVKYVACDGKEFENYLNCLWYEFELYCNGETRVYLPAIDFSCAINAYLVKFNTKEKFETFDECMKNLYCDCYYSTPEKYPFFGVFVEYDGNYCDIYDYDSVMDNSRKAISKMIAFKRKEN